MTSSGRSRASSLIALAGFLVLCYGVAGLGAVATTAEISGWYSGLVKPSWTPPAGLFGPVWTVLYTLMAVAAWLVWRRQGRLSLALWFWLIQLALNGVWSFLFFGGHLIGAAALDIVALLAAIALTMAAFQRVSRVAAWLLAPYLAWVAFATALNLAIWRLNS